MYDLSKDLKNGKAAHLSFFLNYFETVIELLEDLDVNLKMCTPETVLIRVGINDI